MNTDLIRSAAKALIAAIISTVALLFISAGIAFAVADPNEVYGIFAVAILIISALTGGIVSARVAPEKPMLTALCFISVYILIHIASHLIFDGGQASFVNMIISYISMISSAILGCVLTKPKSSKASKGIRKFKKYTKRIHG